MTFVRVEGPASLVSAALQFLYAWNKIPTDFYYASLDSRVTLQTTINLGFFEFTMPYVYVPEHDWDAIGNSVYGQFYSAGSTDLDGVILQTDISAGRASVESAAGATAFVDETLTYERLGKTTWLPWRLSDRNWPRKMLLALAD